MVNIRKYRYCVNFFCKTYADFLKYVEAVKNGETVSDEEFNEKVSLLDDAKADLRDARTELNFAPESNFETMKFSLKGSDRTDLLYRADENLSDDSIADLMKYYLPFNKKDEVKNFTEEDAKRYEVACLLLLVQRGGA